MLLVILIVVLVITLGGGGWGHSRYGPVSWSLPGVVLAVIVVLWLLGRIHI